MLRRAGNRLAGVVLAFSAGLHADVAHAANATECIAAHAEGQRLRREGKLLTADERFLFCSGESCPALIRKDCSAFRDEVEAELPTVVGVLSDDGGGDVRGATVSVDGGVRSLLDG